MKPAAGGNDENAHKALTYSTYLRLDELLGLQTPESSEHDEMLFIVIHQVYELWFKQLLHETDALQGRLSGGDIPRVLHTFKRMLTILKTIVAQVDVLETMTPLEFGAFRDRLGSSSGFQSWQFRELEFALGFKRAGVLKHHADGPREHLTRLEARYRAPSLWDAFLAFLQGQGYAVPPALLGGANEPTRASPELQELLIHIYRHDPAAAEVCERFVDLDEGLQEWRYRHVKMVERTIGHKAGTGGSAGADYLRQTIKPLFPDLWEIRSRL